MSSRLERIAGNCGPGQISRVESLNLQGYSFLQGSGAPENWWRRPLPCSKCSHCTDMNSDMLVAAGKATWQTQHQRRKPDSGVAASGSWERRGVRFQDSDGNVFPLPFPWPWWDELPIEGRHSDWALPGWHTWVQESLTLARASACVHSSQGFLHLYLQAVSSTTLPDAWPMVWFLSEGVVLRLRKHLVCLRQLDLGKKMPAPFSFAWGIGTVLFPRLKSRLLPYPNQSSCLLNISEGDDGV